MKRLFYILALAVILAGCTPAGRLARLVKRHPELIAPVQVIHTDTVVIPGLKYDTAFINCFDTVTIEKERLKVRLIQVKDTIYVSAQVKADTVIRTDTLYVGKVKLIRPSLVGEALKKLPWLISGFFVLMIYFIIKRLVK
jgi:hypothetical protein